MEVEEKQTLLDYFMNNADIDQSNGRKILARFGFSGDAVKSVVSEMSPGERSRLILASLMAKDVNCLVLDEPTNHLDPEALDRLEEALEKFEGTIVMVSHDRYLVEKVKATRTYVLENGQIHPVKDYHEYERRVLTS
jgi:ATPase subunit of ABC transporter with duplicated ATPase domains